MAVDRDVMMPGSRVDLTFDPRLDGEILGSELEVNRTRHARVFRRLDKEDSRAGIYFRSLGGRWRWRRGFLDMLGVLSSTAATHCGQGENKSQKDKDWVNAGLSHDLSSSSVLDAHRAPILCWAVAKHALGRTRIIVDPVRDQQTVQAATDRDGERSIPLRCVRRRSDRGDGSAFRSRTR